MTASSASVSAEIERAGLVRGSATPEGTREYRARFPSSRDDSDSSLDGLRLSSVGIGTYLGDPTDVVESLIEGVRSGINVIDTASVYRGGRSERAVGDTLRIIFETHAREELFVATKGGFLRAPTAAKRPGVHLAFTQRTYIDTGRCEWGDIAGGQHCLRPSFIDGEIDRSRDALGLDTIISTSSTTPRRSSSAWSETTRCSASPRRSRSSSVAVSRATCGTTATWEAFRAAPDDERNHLSLEELVGLARNAGDDRHHFRAIEMPLNLTQSGAFLKPTQRVGGECVTALEAARRLGLYVFTSRTINQDRLDVPFPDDFYNGTKNLVTDAQRLLQFARSLPGVGTALVGTKRRARAREAALVLEQPRLTGEQLSILLVSLLLEGVAA
jgi:aryl-alcohol dehydrogenase-like predicted oxidoreductase